MLEKVVAVDKGGIEDVTDIGRPTAKKEATCTSDNRSVLLETLARGKTEPYQWDVGIW